MVFEHLFPEELLERKEWSAFFLAIIYSTLSIIIARWLFPANSGIVSVIFVSIFLLPYFETILKREERQILKDKRKNFWQLIKDNLDGIEVYYYLFFGIYLTFMAYAFIAPSFGFDIGSVFREQLSLAGIRGGATFGMGTFLAILFNNWWVLLACFLIALIAGDGAIFFIVWNASTWGTIFGYRALIAGANTGESAAVMLLIIVLITLPHVFIEASAYILAAFSGGLLSDQFDKIEEIREFVVYFLCVAMVYGVCYIVFRTLLGKGVVLGVLSIMMALGLLYCMQYVLEKRDALAFKYNYMLFILAIIIFIVGAIVETSVLYNASLLQYVYMAAA